MKLQIKRIKSPKSKGLSQKNKKYQDFLDKKVDQKDVKKSKDKRVIQVKRKIHSPKKNKKVFQDINEIEQKMNQMKTNQMNIQMPTQNKSSEPQSEPQQTVQPKVQSEPQQTVQSKVQPKIPRTRRSNRRSTQRKKSKIHGRKISVKSRVFNKKDIQKVEDKIKEIRGKKTDEIKSELKKQGIKVSGKSNRLLKDIYLYSKMCNINIQHEK